MSIPCIRLQHFGLSGLFVFLDCFLKVVNYYSHWFLKATRAGIIVVSGFMYGIDTMVYRTCLDNDGWIIAVLGCGIDLVRPVANRGLCRQILANYSRGEF